MRVVDLRGRDWRTEERLDFLARRGEILTEEYEETVREIIREVKKRGDRAVIEFTERFDRTTLTEDTLEVPFEELERAYEEVEEDVKEALEIAHERIRSFHESQIERSFLKEEEGILLGQRVIPLERVGVYVPGGKAAYPSTVLMNVVPAVVAGVKEVIMVSPRPNKYTLAAAYISGVSRVFRIGGAQAVAALAFGTKR
ncbi:MAG: histidinol dehydrogenase, partial [Aquificota bacterium]|nr:histidinol dehydrogenase [Aquificota bacterium]